MRKREKTSKGDREEASSKVGRKLGQSDTLEATCKKEEQERRRDPACQQPRRDHVSTRTEGRLGDSSGLSIGFQPRS